MKKNALGIFTLLFCGAFALNAQELYTIDSMASLKLTFFESNWDARLDSLKNANEDAYLLAKSIEINGEVFDSVGVKYKGNSSYSANNAKNPMHIELDYVRGDANYQGYTDIKLGNGFSDPSFVREALSYEILQQYMEAPRANFAQLWINGAYWGVYSNQESINKKFIKKHFYTDGENPFFKCNPTGGAGPGGGNSLPDLVYSSADSAAYATKYELKSDYGWKQLLGLMDTLKNQTGMIEKVLDVDRALWMLAFNDVLVNLDSYTGAFAQNYYLYYDENHRWIPIVWDLNMSMGGFPNLGTGGGGGGLSVTQMQQLDPLVQSSNASRPLISKLLAVPTWKKQYLAHLRTIVQENFANTEYRARALELQSIISDAVQADTKKFFTNTQFVNNIDQTVTGMVGPGGSPSSPGITLLMNARYNYLNTNANVAAAAPAIADVATNPAVPTPGVEVWITASVSNAVSVTLGHRANSWEVFQKISMFDDGAHHDGAGGDGVYGASITADDAENQYYIYAENANAGRFSPERAEFEFHTIVTDLPAPQLAGEVVINEFLADNATGMTDEFGEQEDWLEVFNLTPNAYDLEGLQLTDNADNAAKWVFPQGSVIPANGYLVVWLDEDGAQGDLHTNFKLSKNGEFVMLSNSGGTVFDSLSFGVQATDISFGRYPNGIGNFVSMPTTFGAENQLTSGTMVLETGRFMSISPNPTGDFLHLTSDAVLGSIKIVDARGQTLIAVNSSDYNTEIPVYELPAGVYWLVSAKKGAIVFVKK